MTTSWITAIEMAADTLGEMLVAAAEGEGVHDHEEIAAAVLSAGLAVLLEGPPAQERTEEVARTLHAKLHNGEEAPWGSLTEIEKGFWYDLAVAALAAGDASLLQQAGSGTLPPA